MTGFAAHRPPGASSLARRLARLVTLLPQRLHEGPFWAIQAGVAAVTALHVYVEAAGYGEAYAGFHHLPVAFYIAPIAYAGIKYGFEGALLTGLWSGLLTLPNIVLWHQSGFAWLGEIAYMVVIGALGILVALPVERERRQREGAEATSRRLALLNEVATALAQTRELEGTLEPALARLVEVMGLRGACIALWADGKAEPTVLACRTGLPEDKERLGVAIACQGPFQREAGPTLLGDGLLAVPLGAAGSFSGVLGVVMGDARPLTPEDGDLLMAVGSQVGVAIDNARLHLQEREHLQSYVQLVTQAQEEERQRIARELHDEAAQGLVLLCRRLDTLADAPARRPGLPKATLRSLEDLRGLAQGTLENLRRFSRDLRPAVLDDLGLLPALEWLTADLAQRGGIEASLQVSGEPRRLPAEREVALFRIAQEALRNVERHARASRALVEVAFGGEGLRLSVSDDGQGFVICPAREELARLGKLGLLGMQERAQLVGGTLAIESQPGQGTHITAEVPG